MKNQAHFMLTLAGVVLFGVSGVVGDGFDLDRWTLDGGGDMWVSGGSFELSGTSGQPDAGLVMTGGDFRLTGGFWFRAAGAAVCPGDGNCDDVISWRDIDFFVAAMNDNVAAWEAMFAPGTPTCSFANNDVNSDGTVSWRDIDPLVAVMNTVCP